MMANLENNNESERAIVLFHCVILSGEMYIYHWYVSDDIDPLQ